MFPLPRTPPNSAYSSVQGATNVSLPEIGSAEKILSAVARSDSVDAESFLALAKVGLRGRRGVDRK